MAAIPFFFFFFLLLTLSSTIHARESQFFAKVSNNIPSETESQPLNTNQPTPTFTPQAQVDGGAYGLYGHESGQLPPSATTTTTNNPTTTTAATTTNENNNYLPANLPENYNPVAYTTPIHSTQSGEFNMPQTYTGETKMYSSEKQEEFTPNAENMYNSDKQDEFMTSNGENMYNSENEKQEEFTPNGENMYNSGKQQMYSTQKQGMSDTRFMENGRYYYNGGNTYNSQKQGFEDARFMENEDGGNTYNSQKQGENERYNYNQGAEMYNSQKQGMGETRYSTTSTSSNNANMYNTQSQRQGMSDTRFLENGKYYYDLSMENANANPANMNSRNGYNPLGYSGNTYDKYNSNGGYQNQEEFQNEQFNP